MSAETVDLADVEEHIMELCRRAKVEIGWKFSRAQYANSEGVCGCALEACATVLGFPMLVAETAWPNWVRAARELGVPEEISFGAAFDRAMDGEERCECSDSGKLGQRVAIRLHEEGLA